ncbi:UNKNOWN [Stylonychia lemnae]|uniref:Uncharacterized protein n=1 Tax=Stylonychia lemnae TaxID=5949 RepID=A0A078AWN5_STYLE|nr:UNKNOWN [Stylonychia lemnae]|eukprot:CDW85667.1 UNKNOWN [Stylonychia lemnae]
MKKQRIQGLKLDIQKAQHTLDEDLKVKDAGSNKKMHDCNSSQKSSQKNDIFQGSNQSVHDNSALQQRPTMIIEQLSQMDNSDGYDENMVKDNLTVNISQKDMPRNLAYNRNFKMRQISNNLAGTSKKQSAFTVNDENGIPEVQTFNFTSDILKQYEYEQPEIKVIQDLLLLSQDTQCGKKVSTIMNQSSFLDLKEGSQIRILDSSPKKKVGSGHSTPYSQRSSPSKKLGSASRLQFFRPLSGMDVSNPNPQNLSPIKQQSNNTVKQPRLFTKTFNQSEVIQLQRGISYLMILAQLLHKFERAQEILYIYRDGSITSDNQIQNMVKIQKLSKIKLTYPQFEPLEELERTLQIGLNSLHVSLTPISNRNNKSGGKENGGSAAFTFQDKRLFQSSATINNQNLNSNINNQIMNSPGL